jgi:hypothetical protein
MSCDVIPRTVDRDGEDFRRYNIQGLHERKSRLFRRPCQSTTPGGSVGLLAYYRCGYRDVFFYSSHQKKKNPAAGTLTNAASPSINNLDLKSNYGELKLRDKEHSPLSRARLFNIQDRGAHSTRFNLRKVQVDQRGSRNTLSNRPTTLRLRTIFFLRPFCGL